MFPLDKSIFAVSGRSDIGVERTVNEDHILVSALSKDILVCIMSDGCGSSGGMQPAAFTDAIIWDMISDAYQYDEEMFARDKRYLVQSAMQTANKALGAFRYGNEELYAGMAVATTVAVFQKDDLLISHAGNTRAYLFAREKDAVKMLQLTKDHTKAQELVDNGKIQKDEYYNHPDRYSLTSGLGAISAPKIQIYHGAFRDGMRLLLCSDGVSYAIIPDGLRLIAERSPSPDVATAACIDAARETKIVDNCSAIVVEKAVAP